MMAIAASSLDGRIPVLSPGLLSEEQKAVYARIYEGQVAWARKAGFKASTEDGGLIGPYNSQLLSPGIDSGYLDTLDAEKQHTSLSKRLREVVILSVSSVWNSDYEIYAHSAAGRTAGLSETAIQHLASGSLPDDLNPQERIAQHFARQLSLERRIDADLYAEAKESFGLHGLADIIYLIGIYHIVCGFLNAFEVPVPI